MELLINRNRALAVAQSMNPLAADLGARMCRYLDNNDAVVSFTLEEDDAIRAADALYNTDLLTEQERDLLDWFYA